MANIAKLDEALEKSLESFKEEIKFNLETFYQNNKHPKEFLTKDDYEEITRQTYYVLGEFKKAIIDYLKENSK
jgi:hypothetical protein